MCVYSAFGEYSDPLIFVRYSLNLYVNGVLETKAGAVEQSIMNRLTFIIVSKTKALYKPNALKKRNIKVKRVN